MFARAVWVLSFSRSRERAATHLRFAMSSAKRKVSSFEDKTKIIHSVSSGKKNKAVTKRLEVSQSTLSTPLKAKDTMPTLLPRETSSQRKRLKLAAYKDVDKVVFTSWFMSTRTVGI